MSPIHAQKNVLRTTPRVLRDITAFYVCAQMRPIPKNNRSFASVEGRDCHAVGVFVLDGYAAAARLGVLQICSSSSVPFSLQQQASCSYRLCF